MVTPGNRSDPVHTGKQVQKQRCLGIFSRERRNAAHGFAGFAHDIQLHPGIPHIVAVPHSHPVITRFRNRKLSSENSALFHIKNRLSVLLHRNPLPGNVYSQYTTQSPVISISHRSIDFFPRFHIINIRDRIISESAAYGQKTK